MAEKFKHKFSLVFSSGSARIVELIQLQILAVFFVSLNIGCSYPKELHPVTVKEFSKFVSETNYKTDAEKFGWSFVQSDVLNYDVVSDVNWRVPNGIDSSNYDLPVTQVSYNDAMAFCKWASAKLPDYEEYWKYSQGDQRKIISNAEGIYTVLEVNIIGNVWDITSSKRQMARSDWPVDPICAARVLVMVPVLKDNYLSIRKPEILI